MAQQSVTNKSFTTLRQITFTSPYTETKNVESLCAISPDVALEFAKTLGKSFLKFLYFYS
jgi:hypothetical protein